MSTREKFIVTGSEYEAISRSADTGIRLVKFKDFAINPAHIVSAVIVDRGVAKIAGPEKYVEITEEQREKNMGKLQELKEKLLK